MVFEIRIPDQVINEDADMKRYAAALQAMADRMSMSHFRYGVMRDKYPNSATGLKSMGPRIEKYEASGNVENMLDAANFALIEYLLPSHPDSHFRSEGSHESPGIVWTE